MICPVCKQEIPDGSAVCPICGAQMTVQNAAPTAAPQTPYQYAAPAAPVGAPAQMPTTVKQFIKSMSHIPEYKKMGTEITGSAIVLYICAALTFVVGLVAGNYGVILDVIVLVGLGLWIQLGYSRVAAIIAAVYSVFSMIITTVSTGKISGYLVVIAAVCSVFYTFKAAKAFKQFKESATAVPTQQQFPQQ